MAHPLVTVMMGSWSMERLKSMAGLLTVHNLMSLAAHIPATLNKQLCSADFRRREK